MSDRVRLGIVGLGAAAHAIHLPLVAGRGDLFELVAVADLSPAALAFAGERWGVPPERRHATLDDLLAGVAVDAVMVLTSGSHGVAAAAALRAGVAVFSEKPFAYTVREADEAAAAGGRLMVGYMKLYDPAAVRAAEHLRERTPRAVEVTVLHPPAAAQLAHVRLPAPAGDVPADTLAALARETDALCEEALGPAAGALGRLYTEVLLGSVVHDLAVVRALVGDPERIDHADAWPEGAFPGSVSVEARLPGGGRLALRWHYLERYPAYREEIRVHDEAGSVALVFPSPYLLHAPTVLHVVDADGEAERSSRFRSTVEAFERQLEAFHRLVTSGEPPAAGAAEARADAVTCQRIVRRLAEARGIEVGGEAATS